MIHNNNNEFNQIQKKKNIFWYRFLRKKFMFSFFFFLTNVYFFLDLRRQNDGLSFSEYKWVHFIAETRLR